MYIKKYPDFLLSIAIIVICIAMFVQTYYIKEGLVFGLGAGDFPRGVLAITMLLSLVLLGQSLAAGKGTASFFQSCRMTPTDIKRRWGFMGIILGYIILLPLVNYIALTIAFLVVVMLFLGGRSKKDILTYVVIAGVISFSLKYIFVDMLNLFLP